jgi:hypothetical protein
MARVTGVQIARWAATAGWRLPNLEVAVAIGLANGADPAKPGGVWGVGGPAGDGAGQARAAHDQWRTKGWDEFPAWRSGTWRLYVPLAVASIAAAGVTGAVGRADDVVDQAADRAVGAVTSPFQPAIDLAAYVGTDQFWNRAVKVTLGLGLLLIASVSLAWTMGARPVLRAVGAIDEQIQQQNIGEVTPVRIVK